MNLVLDLGNTSSKLAVFKHDQLIAYMRVDNQSLIEAYSGLKQEFKSIEKGIISNVGHLPDGLITALEQNIVIHSLSHLSRLPFINDYATPNTLGVDRIALVSAAVKAYPNHDVLIIDAGTCITYDFVDAASHYKGGAISPGLRIRYESLHNFTAKLPLLEKSVPTNIIGNSTEQSIHSGVVIGLVKEIDGIIDDYRNRYSDLTVILTGGDAKFLSDQLKNSIFANSKFLLTGLNYLLDYNS